MESAGQIELSGLYSCLRFIVDYEPEAFSLKYMFRKVQLHGRDPYIVIRPFLVKGRHPFGYQQRSPVKRDTFTFPPYFFFKYFCCACAQGPGMVGLISAYRLFLIQSVRDLVFPCRWIAQEGLLNTLPLPDSPIVLPEVFTA
jgi:hypothetical protein